MAAGTFLQVDRGDLHHSEVGRDVLDDDTVPSDGTVLFAVERFGFSANNVTYAVFGDAMGYWRFFPGASGWGRIPVWGFAHVLRSAHPDVHEGARYYGYLPMATHLAVTPTAVSSSGFTDGAEHRTGLPGVYNRYLNCSEDPIHRDRTEDLEMVLRPLFTTSFLLDDHLAEADWFGAEAVVLTSASSKTAYGTARLLHARGDPRPAVVGLTSPSNLAFVRDLGCYDRVLTYDDATTLPAEPTAVVDLAGDPAVVTALHSHLGTAVRWSGIIGDTHWDAAGEPPGTPSGAERSLFFAPDHLERRRSEWGPGGVEERFAAAWVSFVDEAATHLTVVHGAGPDAVRRVYEETLRGQAPPQVAHVLSMYGDDRWHLRS